MAVIFWDDYPQASEASTLILMLINKRLDAVFLSADVFWHALAEEGLDTSLVKYTVQASQPFSCYFPRAYLTANPGFQEEFDHRLARAAQH